MTLRESAPRSSRSPRLTTCVRPADQRSCASRTPVSRSSLGQLGVGAVHVREGDHAIDAAATGSAASDCCQRRPHASRSVRTRPARAGHRRPRSRVHPVHRRSIEPRQHEGDLAAVDLLASAASSRRWTGLISDAGQAHLQLVARRRTPRLAARFGPATPEHNVRPRVAIARARRAVLKHRRRDRAQPRDGVGRQAVHAQILPQFAAIAVLRCKGDAVVDRENTRPAFRLPMRKLPTFESRCSIR